MGLTADMLEDVGRLLGKPVHLDRYLGRKGRAVVARVTWRGANTWIVKGPARPVTDDGSSRDAWSPLNRFRNEVTALRILDGCGGLVPRMLAVDFETNWMILEDLGETTSLADVLLGSDAESATIALSRWATVVGELHRATAEPAMLTRWEAERSELGPLPQSESASLLLASARSRLEQIAKIEAGVDAAVVEVDERLSDRRWWSMTPRDPCPDNCALMPDGSTVLFDFEGGGIRHSLLDAAYLVTTFPTCWCTGSLPAEARAAGIAAYRAAARWHLDDFDEHLGAAAAFHALWVLNSYRMTDALGDQGATGWHWDEVGFDIPSARKIVTLAVDDLHRSSVNCDGLHPLSTFAESLRDGLTRRWGTWEPPSPHPAFAGPADTGPAN